MHHHRTHRFLVPLVLCFAAVTAARAQDIEPRAYSNAPIGVNFLVGGYAYTRGSLPTDSDIPLTSAHIATSNALLAYGHVFEFLGQSAKVDIAAPYSWLGGSALFAGQPITRSVDGLGDTRLRVSVNLFGAPAMDLAHFREYHQDLIIGASLSVIGPTGQYDSSRLVNLGTNRWSIRPEFGISRAFSPLTIELSAGPTFFTNNTNFFRGHTRSQDPILSVQAHAIYDFGSGIWGAIDVQYFTGGISSIDGQRNGDLQRNWRVGGTFALPLSANFSLKLLASTGVSARTGNNFDLVGIFLQYRWGAGL
jgi:Putative MetA-pathway of phenol degradation